jgi:hypothetical protein
MIWKTSDYAGDNDYHIVCTGDVVVGDNVRFDRATFTGSFRNAKFSGFEKVTGKIVNDSYGRDKQQHTFSILLENGGKLRIKGRNLYANGIYRKPWDDESLRLAVVEAKHARGDRARAARDIRRSAQPERF